MEKIIIGMRIFCTSLVISLLSSCAMPNHVGPMALHAKEQVAVATAAWAEAYNSREPARITALYDASALFWGTSAKTVATTPAAVAEYFKNAAQTPEARVALGEQHIRVFGDFAVNTGHYTFSNPGSSSPARYSFVFKYEDGKWMIVNHHSSRAS